MKKYVFIPNDYAKQAFDLCAKRYSGNAVSPLLMEVLGGEMNYDRSMTVCDPEKRVSMVSVVANAKELETLVLNNQEVTKDMQVRRNIGVLKVRGLTI